MAPTEQELRKFLQDPYVNARIRHDFNLSPKTLAQILANPYSNTLAYNSIMAVVKEYYQEKQIIILNLQIFYQNQTRLDKILIADLKFHKTLSNAAHHVTREKALKPSAKDNQTLWERLKQLQIEVQALQEQQQEAEQELNQIVTEKEKVIEQIAAVKRLSNVDKAQIHTQQIKDFALIQHDRIDVDLNLRPSEVKKFTTNAEFQHSKATEFSEKKVELEEKEAVVVNKIDATRIELNQKYTEHNILQATSIFQNEQLQSYQLLPKPGIKQKVENFLEATVGRVFKTPSWMKKAQADLEETRAHKNQTGFRPMAAPAA